MLITLTACSFLQLLPHEYVRGDANRAPLVDNWAPNMHVLGPLGYTVQEFQPVPQVYFLLQPMDIIGMNMLPGLAKITVTGLPVGSNDREVRPHTRTSA